MDIVRYASIERPGDIDRRHNRPFDDRQYGRSGRDRSKKKLEIVARYVVTRDLNENLSKVTNLQMLDLHSVFYSHFPDLTD